TRATSKRRPQRERGWTAVDSVLDEADMRMQPCMTGCVNRYLSCNMLDRVVQWSSTAAGKRDRQDKIDKDKNAMDDELLNFEEHRRRRDGDPNLARCARCGKADRGGYHPLSRVRRALHRAGAGF